MRLSDREAETSESKVCTANLAHRRLFCKSPQERDDDAQVITITGLPGVSERDQSSRL